MGYLVRGYCNGEKVSLVLATCVPDELFPHRFRLSIGLQEDGSVVATIYISQLILRQITYVRVRVGEARAGRRAEYDLLHTLLLTRL